MKKLITFASAALLAMTMSLSVQANHQSIHKQDKKSGFKNQRYLSERLKNIQLPENASSELKAALKEMQDAGAELQEAKRKFAAAKKRFRELRRETR